MLLTSGGKFPDSKPCEPAFVRSPDGNEIACVLRVNGSIKCRSLAMFSNDEGTSWGSPVELDRTITSDRHQPRHTSDGRLVICFRDRTAKSPIWGHFVAWVGTYQDLATVGRDSTTLNCYTVTMNKRRMTVVTRVWSSCPTHLSGHYLYQVQTGTGKAVCGECPVQVEGDR